MKRLLPFLLLCAVSLGAQGQSDSSAGPRVGLVLSGGGAKAMAHIGVLRVIEESGLRIDYIGGTSMGAIVGAMYALGYSVDELEHYLREVNWDALLSNEVPRNRLSYFDRKSDGRYLVQFPIVDGKVQFPQAINYAQYIHKELSSITQHSYQYPDFSSFPIPFFCVATNLENGKARVFEDGSLIDALRASSAFPSLFTPHTIEDTLYVDGGVVSNYPVKYLARKELDYIIGVDVQEFLRSREELNSVARVLEQTSSFPNAYEAVLRDSLTDLLIVPVIPEAGITTFDLMDTIIARGERAARLQAPAIRALAQSQKNKRAAGPSAVPAENLLIQELRIDGREQVTRDYILGRLRLREGQNIPLIKLEQGLERLYGSGYFEKADYRLEPLDTGYRLRLRLKEKNALRSFGLGLNHHDDYKTSLLLNYTERNLFFRNSRLSLDLAISEMPRAELHYFVDRGFVPTLGFKFRSHQFRYRSYANRRTVNQHRYRDYSLDFFLQSTWRDAYAVGGGVQLEEVDISQAFDRGSLEPLNEAYINYYGYIDFDSFDDANYPRQGLQFKANYRLIAAREGLQRFSEPSSVLDIDYKQALGLNPWLSLIVNARGLATIGPNLPRPYQIYLGSMGEDYINYIQPFIGYRFMELSGRNSLMLRADLQARLRKNHYLLLKANYARLEPSFEAIWASDVLLDGYAIGYSFRSPVGPLEFNLAGSTNRGGLLSYVRLGFWF